jgi:hypothetical protein
MAFTRKLGWRDWFHEMFVRQGLFSLRSMPTNRAEDAESTAKSRRDEDLTRLPLDSKSASPD